MNIDSLKKVNLLAKTLRDTGISASMDDAVKMAERIVHDGKTPINEFVIKKPAKEQLISEAVHDKSIVSGAKDRIKEILGDIEESHAEEPEEKEPFILKKTEQKPEEIQKEISAVKEE